MCFINNGQLLVNVLVEKKSKNVVQRLEKSFQFDKNKVKNVSCISSGDQTALCSIHLIGKGLFVKDLDLSLTGEYQLVNNNLREKNIFTILRTSDKAITTSDIEIQYCGITSNRNLFSDDFTDNILPFTMFMSLILVVLFGVFCTGKKKKQPESLPKVKSNAQVVLPALTTSAKVKSSRVTMNKLKKTTLAQNTKLHSSRRVQQGPGVKNASLTNMSMVIQRTYTKKTPVSRNNVSDRSLLRYSVNSVSTIRSMKSSITREGTERFTKIKGVSKAFSLNLSVISTAFKDQLSCLINVTEYKTTEDIMIQFVHQVCPYIQSLISARTIESVDLGNFRSFYLYEEPEVPLKNYLQSLLLSLEEWYSEETLYSYETAPRSLLMAIIYLEKLEANHASVEITPFNIHVILAILILIATKFMEDEVITNKYWGRTCGLSLEDVNALEDIMCFGMNFDFTVELSEISNLIEKMNKGKSRCTKDTISLVSADF